MEPEDSLQHSQEPATCPCPEPYQSSPCLPIPLLEDPFKYYPPIYAWVFQVVSFPQVSPPKPCVTGKIKTNWKTVNILSFYYIFQYSKVQSSANFSGWSRLKLKSLKTSDLMMSKKICVFFLNFVCGGGGGGCCSRAAPRYGANANI
jgi:hypothetical protein